MLGDRLPLLGEHGALRVGAAQPELFDIVERIADLVEDAQRDQQIRVEVRVHVGVQVGAEFRLAADVGLDQRLARVEAVVLRLAHERFRDGGDVRLALDRAVGVDVRDLGIGEPQDIDLAVALVDVAGHFSLDDFQPVLPHAQRQAAEMREVRDQIALRVIRRAQRVAQALRRHVERDDDVLFLVEIKLPKRRHKTPPSVTPWICIHYITNEGAFLSFFDFYTNLR